MKITVKTRLACAKQRIESFGNSRYMISLTSADHKSANAELVSLLSKHFITPASRIQFVRGLESDDKVLEMM